MEEDFVTIMGVDCYGEYYSNAQVKIIWPKEEGIAPTFTSILEAETWEEAIPIFREQFAPDNGPNIASIHVIPTEY